MTIQSNNRLNLELGKKFGKKKQAELVFRANDIFRDRSQVHYSVTDLYTRMDSSTSTQDYYMLSFSYRFNRIEKNKGPANCILYSNFLCMILGFSGQI